VLLWKAHLIASVLPREAMRPTLARMVGAALDAVRALAPTSALS